MVSTAGTSFEKGGWFPVNMAVSTTRSREQETNHLMMWRWIDDGMIFNHLETRRFNGDEIFRWVGVRQAGHMISRMVPHFLALRGRNDLAEIFTTPYSTSIATIFSHATSIARKGGQIAAADLGPLPLRRLTSRNLHGTPKPSQSHAGTDRALTVESKAPRFI